jgi:glycosyltransferase involved in cell wall biosynthesis
MASEPSRERDEERASGVPNTSPLVSVVVPTYGREPAQFRAAIESVREQTYEPLELVVVDDSPAGVSDWVTELDEFTRVERACDGDHAGAADARNTGIWLADGEFIAFLDDDDTWYPEKTARQVAAFEESPDDIGVVYTALEHVRDEDGRVLNRSDAAVTGDVTRDILTGSLLGTFSTLMVRASLVPKAGFVDRRLPILEDREWCLRLSRHCRFKSIRDPLVQYRRGDHEQLTDGFEQLRDVSVPRFERKHSELAASFGPDCKRGFLCSLQRVCAASALSSERYAEARRHATRALRYQPTDRRAWMYLLAALGGRHTHGPLRSLRRGIHGLLTRFRGR